MDAHAHPEWNQVQLDVHRTLARFPPNIGEEERNELQNNLTPLIIQVVSARKQWRYYQGITLFKIKNLNQSGFPP